MKIRLLLILFLTGCYQEKVEKSELNYLSFKISKATLIDNLKAATVLLDRMDGGNGISFLSVMKTFTIP